MRDNNNGLDWIELDNIVRQSLDMLFQNDASLFSNDNSEWAVAHRLAVYLEHQLPLWNIDCEFNRQGEETDVKTLSSGSIVRPDIAIHHRGRVEREYNLVVIELKKTDSDMDHFKVKEFTEPPDGNRMFQYQFGLKLVLGRICKLTWYENGNVVNEQHYSAAESKKTPH